MTQGNHCTICNSELNNIEQVLKARMKPVNGNRVANRVIYKAWCPNCEIFLRKRLPSKKEPQWETSPIKVHELQDELSDKELQTLKSEMEQVSSKDGVPNSKKKWNELISMKKESDKIFSYVQGDASHLIKGYVIKRGVYLIGFFVHEIVDTQHD